MSTARNEALSWVVHIFAPQSERRAVSEELISRNVMSRGRRTSMRLEPELWSALHEICRREGMTMARTIQSIEAENVSGSRTSAVRTHIVRYFRTAATEQGHAAAGHGAAKGSRRR